MKKKIYLKRFLRIGVSLILIIAVLLFSTVICQNDPDIIAVNTKSFYNESNNSLDYIVVGSSAAMSGIHPSVIWNEYQITGNDLCSNGVDSRIYLSQIKEVVKTQTAPVIIIDLDGFTCNFITDVTPIALWLDSMHKNENWKNSIKILENRYIFERYFTLQKYHEMLMSPRKVKYAIDSIIYYDLKNKTSDEKGGLNLDTIRIEKQQVDSLNVINNCFDKKSISDKQKNYLEDILIYLKKSNIKNVLFIDMPKAYYDEEKHQALVDNISQSNYCESIIKEYGYDCIIYSSLENPSNLTNKDFAGTMHLNKSGAVKFSKWIGEYLSKNYSFNMKSQDVIDSWNLSCEEAYKKYNF